MFEPASDERRRGPLERFEKIALAGFTAAALTQAVLGIYRVHRATAGALLAAIAILLCGGLWLLRERQLSGGVLAVPAGLFLATIGVYSGYTATNVPFVSFLGRFGVPALLVLLGALLLFAEQDWQFQMVIFALAAIAFVIAQGVLTVESRAEGESLPVQRETAGGVIGEMQLISLTRTFVDAMNARDAAAKIAIARWIVEDSTVIGFGTASGRPAVLRAEVRNGKIIEWQIYTKGERGNGGSE